MIKTFNEVLDSKGLGYTIEIINYKDMVPYNTDKAIVYFQDILTNNRKTLIDIDGDIDGMLSGYNVKGLFDRVGFKNYTVNRLVEKRHGIDDKTIRRILSEKYEYVIIVDSSTSEMEKLQTLSHHGVKVLVIDHHESVYTFSDYPENVVLINSKVEREIRETPYENVSAGFLTYMVMKEINRAMFGNSLDLRELFLLGYATLYTDSCDMDNRFNISVVQRAQQIRNRVPGVFQVFMNDYDALDRGFIEYKFAPRINALIRSNYLEQVQSIFFDIDEMETEAIVEVIEFTEKVYRSFQALVKEVTDLADITEYNHFVYCNLDSAVEFLDLDRSIVRNATGLVANKVAEKYGKMCVSLITTDTYTMKGSVRDPYSRDMLNIFNKFVQAGGHKPAFGLSLPRINLEGFINTIERINNVIAKEKTEKETIVLNGDRQNFAFLKMQFPLMADYNELSGMSLPIALIKKTITPDMKIYKKEKMVTVRWGDISLTSFILDIDLGDEVLIKPTLTKSGIKYYVNSHA